MKLTITIIIIIKLIIEIIKVDDKSVCQINRFVLQSIRRVRSYTKKIVGLCREKVEQQVHKSRLQNALLDGADR